MERKRVKKLLLASVLSCSLLVPSTLSYAAAGGTPINPQDIPNPNFVEAMKSAVLFPYINGEDVVGSTLSGKYNLSNAYGTDASTFQWYRGDSRNGEYTKIDGQTGTEYVLTKDDLNKYIKFEVTPSVNGVVGKTLKSDPVGPVMSTEEFDKISPRLKKNETYMASRNNLTNEVQTRFGKTIYFNVAETLGGEDHVAEYRITASPYYYKNGTRTAFQSGETAEVKNGKIMVNKAFVSNILDAPDYDFAGKDTVELKAAAETLGKYVFYGTEELKNGTNGNYRSTAQAEGLVIISDEDPQIDVVADRDVLNELSNRVYDLRASEEELQWFHDAKLGMFIHWDPGTMSGSEIGWGRGPGPSHVQKKPNYDLRYLDFNPQEFNAHDIVAKAKEMGCKYLIFTSKHHGGFTSWDSNYYPEHSISGTPYKDAQLAAGEDYDIIKQFADAAHEQDLRFGLYYSPQDWYNDYCWSEEHYRWMETYLGHLTELFGKYGKMDVFWCDAIGSALTMYGNTAPRGWKEAWGAWDPRTILRRVKQLQPGIITNDRYVYRWEDPKPWDEGGLPEDIQGDYITPEQTTAKFDNKHAWESCLTIDSGNAWSYNRDSSAKSPVRVTGDIINNACNDGNVLLNIGLMPNGQFSNKHLAAFETIGEWVQKNGEAIYNTRGGPYEEPSWGGSTYRDNEDGTRTVYLHVTPAMRISHRVDGNVLEIANSPDGKIYSTAELFNQPEVQIDFEKTENGYRITLPEGMSFADGTTMDTLDTIIKLEENFDKSIEQLLQQAESVMAKIDDGTYSAQLNSYKAVIQEKVNALKNAQGDDRKNPYKELTELLQIVKSANEVAVLAEGNESAANDTVVGEHSWELSQSMKDSILKNVADAKELIAAATQNQTLLAETMGRLKSDSETLSSLRTMTVIHFEPESSYIRAESEIRITAENKDVEIRYTLDGTEPTSESPLYENAIQAPKQGAFEVKAAAFYEGKAVGNTYTKLYVISTDEGANLLKGILAETSLEDLTADQLAYLTDGIRDNQNKVVEVSGNQAEFTFDLGSERSVNAVTLFEKYYIGYNELREVEILTSTDGSDYQSVGMKTIQSEGTIRFNNTTARYIRVKLGACQSPIIYEIEAYHVTKPDQSYLKIGAGSEKFEAGKSVELTVEGLVGETAVTPDQVVFRITPEDAGNMEGTTLHVSDSYKGGAITVSAYVEADGRHIESNQLVLVSGNIRVVTQSDASDYYAGPYGPQYAFDGKMDTRWATRQGFDHWISAKLDQSGINRIVIKEYLDTNVWAQPNHSRVGEFTLTYTNESGEEVVFFDSTKPETGTLTRVSPQEIILADGEKWTYVDENGEIACNVLTVSLPENIPADNFKFVTGSGCRDVTFYEIEIYGGENTPSVDKTDLLALYNQYKEEKSEGYTKESWKVFQEGLANAKSVLDNEQASQESVNEALTQLQNAVNQLRVGKETLEHFLNLAKSYVETGEVDGCVESIKTLFEEAIAEGQTIMDKENATKTEVINATAKLMMAVQAIEMKAADKTELEMTFELTTMIDLDKYVEAGKPEYLAAKEKAEEVLADGDAMQPEVDKAWNDLVTAIGNLRLKADKATLEALLESLNGIDLEKYTEESAAVFNEELDRAYTVLENDELTVADQQIVNDAVESLKAAHEGLVLKEDPGEDGNKPGGEDGNKPGGEDGNKPGGEDGNKPGGEDGNKPGGDGGNKPGSEDGNKPDANGNSKPSGNSGSTSGNTTSGKVTMPKTGDSTMFLWTVILLLLSGLAVGISFKKRNR